MIYLTCTYCASLTDERYCLVCRALLGQPELPLDAEARVILDQMHTHFPPTTFWALHRRVRAALREAESVRLWADFLARNPQVN